jgi:hypothetical protein
VLAGEAPFKQKGDPNHQQDGRPENGVAHVPLSKRLKGQSESDQKKKWSGDGAMQGPVLSQIDEARQTHRGEERGPLVLLDMFQM